MSLSLNQQTLEGFGRIQRIARENESQFFQLIQNKVAKDALQKLMHDVGEAAKETIILAQEFGVEDKLSAEVAEILAPGVDAVANRIFAQLEAVKKGAIPYTNIDDRRQAYSRLSTLYFEYASSKEEERHRSWQTQAVELEQKLVRKDSDLFHALLGNVKSIGGSDGLNGRKRIYLAYSWPDPETSDEQWILQFLETFGSDLERAGFEVSAKQTQKTFAPDESDIILLFGSQTLLKDYNARESETLGEIQSALKKNQARQNPFDFPVVPILLSGERSESFPPQFYPEEILDLCGESLTRRSYPLFLKELLEGVYQVPLDSDNPDRLSWEKIWVSFWRDIESAGLSWLKQGLDQGAVEMFHEKNELPLSSPPKNSSYDFPTGQVEFFRPKALQRVNIPTCLASFVGREKELDQMHQLILQNNLSDQAAPVVLHGRGGVGKSELATKFAEKYQAAFSLIYTIQASSEAHVQHAYLELAGLLELYVEKDSHEAIVGKVHKRLEAGLERPWLLVFDNAVNAFSVPKRGGGIIVTTQNKNLWPDIQETIAVNEFSFEEALSLFDNSVEQEKYKELFDKLEGLPLLLMQARQILRDGVSVSAYLKLINKENPLWEKTERYPQALSQTYQITLKRVKEISEYGYAFLKICAYLQPDMIHKEQLSRWLSNQGRGSLAASIGIRRLLTSWSLLEQEGDYFKMHRLLQLVLNKLHQEEEDTLFKQALELVEEGLQRDLSQGQKGLEYGKVSAVHAEQFQSNPLWSELISPEQQADFLSKCGKHYLEHGLISRAIEYEEKALKIREKHFGETHQTTGCSYNALGKAYSFSGRIEEGMHCVLKALAIRERYKDEKPLELGESYTTIGVICSLKGEDQKSLEHQINALTIYEQQFGENHPNTSEAYLAVGKAYGALNRFSEELEAKKKALSIAEKVLGKKNPHTASIQGAVGVAYGHLGNYVMGLEYSERALGTIQATVGDRCPYPGIATFYQSVGSGYFIEGRYKEGLEYGKKGLNICLDLLGENHILTANSYDVLVDMYSRIQEYHEAIKYKKKILEIYQKIFGEQHSSLIAVYNNIGVLYQSLGQQKKNPDLLRKGVEYLHHAREIVLDEFGLRDPKIAVINENIMKLSYAADKMEELPPTYLIYDELKLEKQFLEENKVNFGEKAGLVANNHVRIGLVHGKLAEDEEAFENFTTALKICREIAVNDEDFLQGSVFLGQSCFQFSAKCVESGKYQRSIDWLEKTTKLLEEFLGKEAEIVGLSYGNLAWSLALAGKYREGQKACYIALNIYQNVFGEGYRGKVAYIIDTLAFISAKSHLYDQAFIYAKRALNYQIAAIGLEPQQMVPYQIRLLMIQLKRGDLDSSQNIEKAIDLILQLDTKELMPIYKLRGLIRVRAGRKDGLIDLEQAIGIAESNSDFFERAEYLIAMGRALTFLGRYDEALENFKEALDVQRKYQPDHPDVAETLCEMGAVYHQLKKDDDALRSYQNALEIRSRIFEKDSYIVQKTQKHIAALTNTTVVAEVIAPQLQEEKSPRLSKVKSVVTDEIFGEVDPFESQMLMAGIVYGKLQLEEHEKVIKQLEITFRIYREVAPGEIQYIQKGCEFFGYLCFLLNDRFLEGRDYEKSIVLLEKAINLFEDSLGQNATIVAKAYENLAWSIALDGRYEEARTKCERAIKIYQSALGNRYIDEAINAMGILSFICKKLHLYGDAFAYALQVVQCIEGSFDFDKLIPSRIRLGQIEFECGKSDLLENADARIELCLKINTTQKHLADAYMVRGLCRAKAQIKKGIDDFKQSLEIQERLANSVKKAECLYEMGRGFIFLGKFEKALRRLKDALRIQKETLSYDHPDIAETFHQIGLVHEKLKNEERALKAYRHALRIRTRAFGREHAITKETEGKVKHFLKKPSYGDSGDVLVLSSPAVVQGPNSSFNLNTSERFERVRLFAEQAQKDLQESIQNKEAKESLAKLLNEVSKGAQEISKLQQEVGLSSQIEQIIAPKVSLLSHTIAVALIELEKGVPPYTLSSDRHYAYSSLYDLHALLNADQANEHQTTWREHALQIEQDLMRQNTEAFRTLLESIKALSSRSLIGQPCKVYMVFAWPSLDFTGEDWTLSFLDKLFVDLERAGLLVSSRQADPSFKCHESDVVLAMGTRAFLQSYTKRDPDVLEDINTILFKEKSGQFSEIPILISGLQETSFPLELQFGQCIDLVNGTFERKSYPLFLKGLLEELYQVPANQDHTSRVTWEKVWDTFWQEIDPSTAITLKNGIAKWGVEEYLKHHEPMMARGKRLDEKESDHAIKMLDIEGEALKFREYLQESAVRSIQLPPPLKCFMGRRQELEQLEHLAFRENLAEKAALVVLHGEGGIGKTELGLEYARRHRESFSFIYLVQASTKDQLEQAYLELGTLLDLYIANDSHGTIVEKVHQRLEAGLGQSWLLLFDDVKKSLPLPRKGGLVIATSQKKKLWPDEQEVIEVGGLRLEDAFAKFSSLKCSEELFKSLFRKLQGHPLLLSQAYQQIEEGLSTEEYLALVEEENLVVESSRDYSSAVARSYRAAIEKIKQTLPDAYQFLKMCAYLNPGHIHKQLLSDWLELRGKRSMVAALRIRSLLSDWSLFEQSGDQFKMQPLLQKLLRSDDQEVEQSLFLQAVSCVQGSLNVFKKDDVTTWKHAEIATPHIRFLQDHPFWEASLDSSAQAKAFSTTGQYYALTGNYPQAIRMLKKAMKIQEKNRGKKHADTAKVYVQLERAYARFGNLDNALKYGEKALGIFLESFGEKHVDTARSYDSLGWIKAELGDYEEGLKLLEKSLHVNNEILGAKDVAISINYSHIGLVQAKMGDDDLALKSHKKASKLLEQVSVGTLSSGMIHSNLGLAYVAVGLYEKALEYGKKALKVRKELLGEMHPHTGASYANVGFAYYRLEKYSRAMKNYQRALKINQKTLGERHPNTALVYRNLEAVYRAIGNHKTALAYRKKALAIEQHILQERHERGGQNIFRFTHGALQEKGKVFKYEERRLEVRLRVLGEDHLDTARSYRYLGAAYVDMSQPQKALEFLNKALMVFDKHFEGLNLEVAEAFSDLGKVHILMQNPAGALQCEETAFRIFCELLGDSDLSVGTSYVSMGKIYAHLFDFPKAAEYSENALKIYQKSLWERHPELAACYFNCGLASQEIGDYPKALNFFQLALEIHQNTLGEKNGRVAIVYSTLALIYSNAGNQTVALEHAKKALEIRKEVLGEMDTDTLASYYQVAEIYRLSDRLDKANEYKAKRVTLREQLLGEGHPDLALDYFNLGLSWAVGFDSAHKKKSYTKTFEYYEKALDIFSQEPINLQGIETICSTIGPYVASIAERSAQLGNYEDGVGCLQKAISVAQRFQNGLVNAFHYGMLGFCLAKLGQYDEAKIASQESLDLCGGEASSLTVFALEALALIQTKLGDEKSALEYAERALEAARQRISTDEVRYHASIALIQLKQENLVEALESAAKAISRSPDIIWKILDGDPDFFGRSYGEAAKAFAVRGLIRAQSGDKEGLDDLENSLKIQKTVPNKIELADCLEMFGQAQHMLKDPETALSRYLDALGIRQAHYPNHPDTLECLHQVSLVLFELDRDKEAFEYARQTIVLACRLYNKKDQRFLRYVRFFVQNLENTSLENLNGETLHEVYALCASTLGKQHKLVKKMKKSKSFKGLAVKK